ncbi:prolyl oligopeptidase family serine peptidase [Paenibacillus sp. LMG 31461]|uniref:Prolyl oligopeptidase family serine peptidase n=1 Tax=Paenibacillus plantarum TaxID=2654975 RepID=A0ABX1X8H5_9BACL|nr:prolyl oligopeptidase family serine peptidase [Paenibacillus plantarum]NOU64622.1 prolyl oligopeptidase family serine peptidase [Paenibacillus plantarum]
MEYEKYEDRVRMEKQRVEIRENQYSPYCDFIYYNSSRHPELQLAMRVLKPGKPSRLVVTTHGWHMSIPPFEVMDTPCVDELIVEVDMRGRAFSEGSPDCNGWELFDVIDAVTYVQQQYESFIEDSSLVYFEGGSGGGGNAYAIIAKFPDFFAAATAMCGITDYTVWYENDAIGEFQDELDVWIGHPPRDNPMAYASRSGLALASNLLTPLFICHGDTDIRVPVDHARMYKERLESLNLSDRLDYWELEGVGTREHWGHATQQQMVEIHSRSEQHRARHATPIDMPERGRFMIGGYLFTKRFSIVLDSLDHMAMVDYDLVQKQFIVTSVQGDECGYKLELYGGLD